MAIVRKVKPVVLDETMQKAVDELGEIKDILNNKMFTPSVIIDAKTITENGTYIAEAENADGYAKITVDVAGGGGGGGTTDPLWIYLSIPLEEVQCPENLVVPKNVKELNGNLDLVGENNKRLIYDVRNVKSVTLENGHTGLTKVGNVFKETDIEDISFAKGAELGESAFYGCNKLESVDCEGMKLGVNEWGGATKGVFENCENLETVTNAPYVEHNGKVNVGEITYWQTKLSYFSCEKIATYCGWGTFAHLTSDSFESSSLSLGRARVDEGFLPDTPTYEFTNDVFTGKVPDGYDDEGDKGKTYYYNTNTFTMYSKEGEIIQPAPDEKADGYIIAERLLKDTKEYVSYEGDVTVGWNPDPVSKWTVTTGGSDISVYSKVKPDKDEYWYYEENLPDKLYNEDGTEYSPDENVPHFAILLETNSSPTNIRYYIRWCDKSFGYHIIRKRNAAAGDWEIRYEGQQSMSWGDAWKWTININGEDYSAFTTMQPDNDDGTWNRDVSEEITFYDENGEELPKEGSHSHWHIFYKDWENKWCVEYIYGLVPYLCEFNGEFKDNDCSNVFESSAFTTFTCNTLKKITREMFKDCSNLETVTTPLVERVGENAFQSTALKTLIISACKYFNARAIESCNSLEEIDLSAVMSVTQIVEESSFPTIMGSPITVKVPNILLADFKADEKWGQLETNNTITLQGV